MITDLKMTLRRWLAEGLDQVDERFLLVGAKRMAEGLMELEGLAGKLPRTNDMWVEPHAADSLGAGGG